MSSFYKNGYQETIQKGLSAVQSFRSGITDGFGSREEKAERLKKQIESADAIVIGAGAGLSTAAGLTYSGERFDKYFGDFAEAFGIQDIYSGGFYPFQDDETRWAWWSRHIYVNRYVMPPKPIYDELYELVKDKDYFVLTTNVDHQFQKAGFDKGRLFYTQGDYGLWQCSTPCHNRTYDNKGRVVKMLLSQGFSIGENSELIPPQMEDGKTDFRGLSMTVPSSLIQYCPVCGEPMTMNLRSDNTFVEDEGWHKASAAYADYLNRQESRHVLYLEIGVGANTPVIIKYPFWAMTAENPNAVYACLNFNESFCPKEIGEQAICIDGDAGMVIERLK